MLQAAVRTCWMVRLAQRRRKRETVRPPDVVGETGAARDRESRPRVAKRKFACPTHSHASASRFHAGNHTAEGACPTPG